jgi:proteasome lid subunit RPN8/RPN11
VVTLLIERRYIEEMIDHAREEAPNECCGILGGKDSRVLKLYRATNAEHSRYCYKVDSEDLFRIHDECEAQGWQFVGIYHSHPETDAYPSPTDVRSAFWSHPDSDADPAPTDVRLALWPDSLCFVVSLRDPENPIVRAFRIEDRGIAEEELRIL